MKSPERLKDFEDGSPAPIPPLDYSTQDGLVWYAGGWWQPSTLPYQAQMEFARREYARDMSAISTPRQ